MANKRHNGGTWTTEKQKKFDTFTVSNLIYYNGVNEGARSPRWRKAPKFFWGNNKLREKRCFLTCCSAEQARLRTPRAVGEYYERFYELKAIWVLVE